MFREKHGEPDIITVRKVFSDGQLARNWEHRVLNRLKVEKNRLFLNMSSILGRGNLGSDNGMFGKKRSAEEREHMRDGWARRREAGKSNKNMARCGEQHPMWGKSQKRHVVDALTKANLGSLKSDVTKEKLRQQKLGCVWWNNGITCKLAKEKPGEEWYKGRRLQGI